MPTHARPRGIAPFDPVAWERQRAEERQVDASLMATLEAIAGAVERGEDPDPAIAAACARVAPPPPPTLDALVVARIGGGGWTPERQRAFLVHLAETGSVAHACRHVGLSKQSAYQLRHRHPTAIFAIAWDVAVRMGRRRLLDEAFERALDGREVPVWHRGEQVGTRVVHNDRLLMFLLGHTPEAAHPVLAQREVEELWPAMMAMVDAVLPPTLTPERLADMVGEGCENGNDWA